MRVKPSEILLACIWLDSGATNKTRLLLFHAQMEFFCVVTDRQYSEAIFMVKKMAKIWHKVQENGTKSIRLAKVVAKEKKILAQTLKPNKIFWVGGKIVGR